MIKSERILTVIITSIVVIGLVVITKKTITTDKIKTPYGVLIKLSYKDNVSTIENVRFYTIEDDFIYFYDKNKPEPFMVVAKNKVDAITMHPKPDNTD